MAKRSFKVRLSATRQAAKSELSAGWKGTKQRLKPKIKLLSKKRVLRRLKKLQSEVKKLEKLEGAEARAAEKQLFKLYSQINRTLSRAKRLGIPAEKVLGSVEISHFLLTRAGYNRPDVVNAKKAVDQAKSKP